MEIVRSSNNPPNPMLVKACPQALLWWGRKGRPAHFHTETNSFGTKKWNLQMKDQVLLNPNMEPIHLQRYTSQQVLQTFSSDTDEKTRCSRDPKAKAGISVKGKRTGCWLKDNSDTRFFFLWISHNIYYAWHAPIYMMTHYSVSSLHTAFSVHITVNVTVNFYF